MMYCYPLQPVRPPSFFPLLQGNLHFPQSAPVVTAFLEVHGQTFFSQGQIESRMLGTQHFTNLTPPAVVSWSSPWQARHSNPSQSIPALGPHITVDGGMPYRDARPAITAIPENAAATIGPYTPPIPTPLSAKTERMQSSMFPVLSSAQTPVAHYAAAAAAAVAGITTAHKPAAEQEQRSAGRLPPQDPAGEGAAAAPGGAPRRRPDLRPRACARFPSRLPGPSSRPAGSARVAGRRAHAAVASAPQSNT